MASGNYKGAGFNVPDLLLYGALGVAAYFIYTSVVKPTSEVTGAVGSVADETAQSYKSVSDLFQAGVKKVEDFVEGDKNNTKTSSTKSNSSTKINSVADLSPKNYVTSISSSGTAYGAPIVTVKTNTGQSSTIGAKENTYYPSLGIGFNSKGQGYSSMTPIKV